ncbi:MAG: hypothetical protein AAB265_04965, partial [candidate division NC10 bacterium]
VVGEYVTPSAVVGVAVKEATAFVVGPAFGLEILDLSAARTPRRLAGVDTPGTPWQVVLGNDGFVYIADGAAGVQVVDRRHWNLGWAMTFGAFTTVAAVAAASVAPFRMNRLRPSIDTSMVWGSSLTATWLLVIDGQRIPQPPVLLGQTGQA